MEPPRRYCGVAGGSFTTYSNPPRIIDVIAAPFSGGFNPRYTSPFEMYETLFIPADGSVGNTGSGISMIDTGALAEHALAPYPPLNTPLVHVLCSDLQLCPAGTLTAS
jgi:hypothetical protein